MSLKQRINLDKIPKIPVLQQLVLLAGILLLIFGGAFTPSFISSKLNPEMDKENMTAPQAEIKKTEPKPAKTAFTHTYVAGKAAYVFDVNQQKTLYQKNELEALPLASLTKLMTALVAHELLQENDTITINQTAIKQDGASGLLEGETFDRLALSDLTLISSSNDGAYALAYAAGSVLSTTDPANAFVQAMNIRAKEIGLENTFYKNPTGLDISLTEGGAYGTAKDMATLIEYIIVNAPTILEYTKDTNIDIASADGNLHEIENTNYFVDEVPGLIGSKTGYTDLAGGNLVVAFEAGLNRPIIVVVLGSTRQERFSDVITLVKETKKYLSET